MICEISPNKRHNFNQGICAWCQLEQPHHGWEKKEEEITIDRYFKKTNIRNPVLHDIWEYFAKELPFPRLAKMSRDIGNQAMYEIWRTVIADRPKNEIATFIWEVEQDKKNIIWQ